MKLVFSKVMLNIEQFVVDGSYAQAKVLDNQGDTISINIQGGNYGIGLQENLLKLLEKIYAYLITKIRDIGKLVARKLPILGVKD
jgi:DNA gyrase inhibitor GyrI